MKAHEHMKAKKHSSALTMKYDGSPSLVFGHHPVTKKFFVATKSAFNKNPKLNHTEADIERNHGHAPGLVSKLKHALKHLPKVTPKHGVYQGDLMHTRSDHKLHEGVSFTPNTITYTARGDEEKKVKQSHVGIVVHQQYHPHPTKSGVEHMTVSPHPDTHNFKQHPDVHLKTAEHDTSKINTVSRSKAHSINTWLRQRRSTTNMAKGCTKQQLAIKVRLDIFQPTSTIPFVLAKSQTQRASRNTLRLITKTWRQR